MQTNYTVESIDGLLLLARMKTASSGQTAIGVSFLVSRCGNVSDEEIDYFGLAFGARITLFTKASNLW